jgi:hypothetical protein
MEGSAEIVDYPPPSARNRLNNRCTVHAHCPEKLRNSCTIGKNNYPMNADSTIELKRSWCAGFYVVHINLQQPLESEWYINLGKRSSRRSAKLPISFLIIHVLIRHVLRAGRMKNCASYSARNLPFSDVQLLLSIIVVGFWAVQEPAPLHSLQYCSFVRIPASKVLEIYPQLQISLCQTNWHNFIKYIQHHNTTARYDLFTSESSTTVNNNSLISWTITVTTVKMLCTMSLQARILVVDRHLITTGVSLSNLTMWRRFADLILIAVRLKIEDCWRDVTKY